MADCSNIVTAVIHPPPKDEEHPQENEEVASAEAKVESHGESDAEESYDEVQFDLDEPSDSENYDPKTQEGEEDDKLDEDDDSCSSGEEEDIDIDVVEFGGQKFSKLKYADLEAKKRELEKNIEEDEEECKEEEEKTEGESQEEGEKAEGEFQEDEKSKTVFMEDENMDEDYKSDDEEPYNPVYSDLSDIEYPEDDERDTESETEIEIVEGTHKKTGKALVSLKMTEPQLKIPPIDQAFSPGKLSIVKPSGQPMECS